MAATESPTSTTKFQRGYPSHRKKKYQGKRKEKMKHMLDRFREEPANFP
jgi:hypothetical protein